MKVWPTWLCRKFAVYFNLEIKNLMPFCSKSTTTLMFKVITQLVLSFSWWTTSLMSPQTMKRPAPYFTAGMWCWFHGLFYNMHCTKSNSSLVVTWKIHWNSSKKNVFGPCSFNSKQQNKSHPLGDIQKLHLVISVSCPQSPNCVTKRLAPAHYSYSLSTFPGLDGV